MSDFILYTIIQGLGILLKKLAGFPISKTGNSEMWLGAVIISVLFVSVVAAVHYWR
jgi:hypothetical protein